MNENELSPRGGQILICQTESGQTKIEVHLENETLWLSQNALAQLYRTTKQNISLHVANIYEEGELLEDAVVKEYLTTAADGKNYHVKHYNLDLIIAVGYRVRSHVATHFRQWAAQRLREYIVKGFILDNERLKYQPYYLIPTILLNSASNFYLLTHILLYSYTHPLKIKGTFT